VTASFSGPTPLWKSSSGLNSPSNVADRSIRVRVQPAAAPAMSVMPRKGRSATKMRSVAMGQKPPLPSSSFKCSGVSIYTSVCC
jgi:hypothetical protein